MFSQEATGGYLFRLFWVLVAVTFLGFCPHNFSLLSPTSLYFCSVLMLTYLCVFIQSSSNSILEGHLWHLQPDNFPISRLSSSVFWVPAPHCPAQCRLATGRGKRRRSAGPSVVAVHLWWESGRGAISKDRPRKTTRKKNMTNMHRENEEMEQRMQSGEEDHPL